MWYYSYMKRIVLVVLMLTIASLAFAQYVEDMDGHDWRQWSYDHKVGYVQGFYSAYSSVWEWILVDLGDSTTEDDRQNLERMFFINVSIGDMIDRIDEFYNTYKNREYTIYSTLMWIAGKDYWN